MKKIMTFEEEKRSEEVKNTYSTVFIMAIFAFVLRLLLHYVIIWANGMQIFNSLKTGQEIVLSLLAVALPFLVYARLSGVDLMAEAKSKMLPPLMTAVFSVGLVGFALFIKFPLTRLFDFMVEDGFIFSEPFPFVSQGIFSQIVYILLFPLLSTVVIDFIFRISVLKAIKKTSGWFSLLVVFITNLCLFPTWSSLPLNAVLAFSLSWLYLKTNSTLAVFISGYLARLAFVLPTAGADKFLMYIGAALFFAAAVFVMFYFFPTLPKNEEGAFSKKEALRAAFMTSVLYIMLFCSFVQVFFFYAKKPEKEMKEETKVEARKDVREQRIGLEFSSGRI